MNINPDVAMAILGTKEYELVLLRQRIMQLEERLKKYEGQGEPKLEAVKGTE